MDEENFILQNGMSESFKTDFQNLNYEKRKELSKESLASDQEFGNGDPCLYVEGDLVWVNVKGSPLWPAMITTPVNETFYTKFRLKKLTNELVGPRQYHVQFFCDNYRMMWVSSKTIFIYEGLENLKSYCEKLKLNVKSCKNTKLFAERNLLKAFSKLSSRTISSNNSKSFQWNQAVLEADQILPLERCERILKFEAPRVKEIKEKHLNENPVFEENYDAANSSISSLMSSSVNLNSVSNSTCTDESKWKSLSSTCDSSDEISGFEEDYSIERRKPKGRKSLKRLKIRGEEDLLDSDLDIKHEIEIKEEPLELSDEYLCHENESNYESMMHHKQTSENFDGVLDSVKSIVEEAVKIDADNEGKDIELKIEIQGRHIEYENLDSKIEGNPLNHDSHEDEETLFRRLEYSEFPKVILQRLNIGIEKASEICTENAPRIACRNNFGKIEVEHIETFDEVHDGDTEDNDYYTKADIDVKNKGIEDFIEDKGLNLNDDVICKRNFGAKTRGIKNKPKKKTEIFDSPSPSSSGLGNEKRNIIKQKNEERKEEGNEIKDFESRKRIKLDAIFECSLCDYKTNRKRNLKSHSSVHSTEKLFKCSECDHGCNSKNGLKYHLLTHSNTKLFKCSECDYKCYNKNSLKLHLLTHSNTKLFKCSECDYECNQKGNLKFHLLTHSNTKLFKCSECDYECNHKISLKLHLLSHSNTKLFKCFECHYGCNDKSHLKRHLMSHSNTKLFKCSECDYGCNDKRYLKIHLLSHSNTKLFKCSECDYECNHKNSLKLHLLSHSNTKLFKCSECDYECNQKGNLKIHLLSHSNTKLFKCSECNYECNRKGNFKIHLLKHSNTKLFKCSECDYECNHENSLKLHLLSHSNTKLFKCSECDYECNHKNSLKLHLLSHSNTKLFKCCECDYGCNNKRILKIHLLTHSNTKLFKCSECDYECNHKISLKLHLLSHSNTKLFKCSECDYECNRISDLKDIY